MISDLTKKVTTVDKMDKWTRTTWSNIPPGVIDGYPDEPIGITRDIMKPMMLDLLPGMTEEGFELAFDEIDLDGGGEIEFDEFIEWLAKEELDFDLDPDEKVEKPGFEQLGTNNIQVGSEKCPSEMSA